MALPAEHWPGVAACSRARATGRTVCFNHSLSPLGSPQVRSCWPQKVPSSLFMLPFAKRLSFRGPLPSAATPHLLTPASCSEGLLHHHHLKSSQRSSKRFPQPPQSSCRAPLQRSCLVVRIPIGLHGLVKGSSGKPHSFALHKGMPGSVSGNT